MASSGHCCELQGDSTPLDSLVGARGIEGGEGSSVLSVHSIC